MTGARAAELAAQAAVIDAAGEPRALAAWLEAVVPEDALTRDAPLPRDSADRRRSACATACSRKAANAIAPGCCPVSCGHGGAACARRTTS